MAKQFAMPGGVSYFIRPDVPVYLVRAVNINIRKTKPKNVLFILHDTAGTDSRQELYDSSRRVSVHYLVGAYDGNPNPKVIKYMSEFDNYANGAGNGKLGGYPKGINPHAVHFEIEYTGMNPRTLDAYAATVAQSMRIWRDIGSNVVMLPHFAVDARKYDPRFDWNEMAEQIYRYSHIY